MECALSCWEGGAFVKKDFRDAYFKPKYVFFDFIVTALTPLTRYHFYLRFLRKLEEKAPNWTLKMRENMYQQVL